MVTGIVDQTMAARDCAPCARSRLDAMFVATGRSMPSHRRFQQDPRAGGFRGFAKPFANLSVTVARVVEDALACCGLRCRPRGSQSLQQRADRAADTRL